MINRRFSREIEPSAPINWRRGLFRLWILISTAWLMGWLIYFAIQFVGGESTARDIPAIPVVLFGPPLALLFLGVATRWAIRGFES
jgi:hypothetical protein